jgi:hypothetical protein
MEDLTKTITYYYIQDDSRFETDNDRNNFIKYCEYMMFSNYEEPRPILDEDYKEYFRSLYKAVEMRYEEDVMEANYIKEQEELEEKENDEMKYYEIHYDYNYNVNYYEDLYLTYNNKYK